MFPALLNFRLDVDSHSLTRFPQRPHTMSSHCTALKTSGILQTCKKLSCFPEKYFLHMNVFLSASGERGKRGNVHVSPEMRNPILHPYTTIYVILESAVFSGNVPNLCQSQEDQREAYWVYCSLNPKTRKIMILLPQEIICHDDTASSQTFQSFFSCRRKMSLCWFLK